MDADMTTLYLIRHGRTDWNDAGRYQGQANPPLNAQGWAQARALAQALSGVPFEAIYGSAPRTRSADRAGPGRGHRPACTPGPTSTRDPSGGVGRAAGQRDPGALPGAVGAMAQRPAPCAPPRRGDPARVRDALHCGAGRHQRSAPGGQRCRVPA
ncbi:MAG: hypothetical protein C4311_02490 [Chloroflexota bacterium]